MKCAKFKLDFEGQNAVIYYMAQLNIAVAENNVEERMSIIDIEGSLNTLTVPELEKILGTLSGLERHRVIINLSAVEYISSAGWSSLVTWSEKQKAADGYFCLAGMIPNVHENFLEFEFDKIIDFYENANFARKEVLEGKMNIQVAG